MTAVCANIEDVSLTAPVVNFKCRRVLRGHRGRILHFDWSPDKIHVLTAGQVEFFFSENNKSLYTVLLYTGWMCFDL